MALSEWSEDRARDAAQFLQAIAHPTRLLLLLLLAERPLPASKLARAVGVSQPAAFRHLWRMVEAGILSINDQYKNRKHDLCDRFTRNNAGSAGDEGGPFG